MSSFGETDGVAAQVEQAKERDLRSRQSKGGYTKSALYCSECEGPLDEPHGSCEFCARLDAVLEGDL